MITKLFSWRREREFRDDKGNPALLPMEGNGPTFSDLVKRFSGNVPPAQFWTN